MKVISFRFELPFQSYLQVNVLQKGSSYFASVAFSEQCILLSGQFSFPVEIKIIKEIAMGFFWHGTISFYSIDNF